MSSSSPKKSNVIPDLPVCLELSLLPAFRDQIKQDRKVLVKLGAELEFTKEEIAVILDMSESHLVDANAAVKPVLDRIPNDMIQYAAVRFFNEIHLSRAVVKELRDSPLKPLGNDTDDMSGLEMKVVANGEELIRVSESFPDQTHATLRIERNERTRAPLYDIFGEVEIWEDLGEDNTPPPAITPLRIKGMFERLLELRVKTREWISAYI